MATRARLQTFNTRPPASQQLTGLNTPLNDSESASTERVGFRFVGGAMPAWVPASYLWRYTPKPDVGFRTLIAHGSQHPDGGWIGDGWYYIFCPYPYTTGVGGTGPSGAQQHWCISINGTDTPNVEGFEGFDDNGNSTLMEHGREYIQYGQAKLLGNGDVEAKYYYDLPDLDKVLTYVMPAANVQYPPGGSVDPALMVLSNSWAPLVEQAAANPFRGLRIFGAVATDMNDVLLEAANNTSNTMVTAWGQANIHYSNMNPTPSDISDKSGEGHDPEWVNANRPDLWTA